MKWSDAIKTAKDQGQARIAAKVRRGQVNAGELGEDVKQLEFLAALEKVLQGAPDDDQ